MNDFKKYEFYCRKCEKWVKLGINGECMKCKEKKLIFKGKALKEIQGAWKETCKHFGIKYNKDFWDIKIKDVDD